MSGLLTVVRAVPATKLWRMDDADSSSRDVGDFIIVLRCDCGAAVDYPGHPDERVDVTCEGCGIVWTIRPELAR